MPGGAKTQDKRLFHAKFDQLANQYADPVEFLFAVLAKDGEEIKEQATLSDQIDAAKTLLAYRHPKLKAVDATIGIEADKPQRLEIVWDESESGQLGFELPGDTIDGEVVESLPTETAAAGDSQEPAKVQRSGPPPPLW